MNVKQKIKHKKDIDRAVKTKYQLPPSYIEQMQDKKYQKF